LDKNGVLEELNEFSRSISGEKLSELGSVYSGVFSSLSLSLYFLSPYWSMIILILLSGLPSTISISPSRSNKSFLFVVLTVSN
jgi:hypothetical protein